MDLSIQTESYGQGDTSWLGSRHGVDTARPATLDLSTFTKNTHYPQGFLLSGLPLKVGSGGKYALWTSGTNLAGFLLFDVKTPKDGADRDPVGARLEHGRVIVAKLPVTVDAAGQATNPHFIYA